MTVVPTVLVALFTGVAVFCARPGEFEGGTMERHRRSIAGFGFLITCKAKRNPFNYNGYGCYCGLGGYGKPVDGLDKCCQVHDTCYQLLERRFNIHGIANYIAPYLINYFWCKCTGNGYPPGKSLSSELKKHTTCQELHL
ncbi:PREDICTED: phospholipase A2 A2-actitoxin-Cgg2a-like [Acropora digitifera]|uniref:phospholipase A2 A2-actitoxin-Cgg2a-like n=1 Tax=Acropora digitifera TaxID=70779 RepID=UPI00077A5D23|nr:PREDICTED: phospholipase A2 A2-actitoxin-Cgg2a-like [Acropora digitifera]